MTNQSKEAMDVRSPEWTAECDHGECFGGRCLYQSKEEGSFSGGATERKTRDVAGILHFLTPQQMAEEIVRLDAVRALSSESEAALDRALAERDSFHEWADKLADAIGAHLGIDIGEHTAGAGANNPWARALDAIEGEAPTDANECRIELVTTVHGLISQIENTLHAFGGDAEAKRQAEGAIAHARAVAAKWNWNGPWSALSSQSETPRMLTSEELRSISSIYEVHNVDPEDAIRKFCEVNGIPLSSQSEAR